MKAIVYTEYGSPDVLRLEEVPRPVPTDGEILIKTYATTVTSGDRRVRSLDVPFGFGLISRLVFGVFKPRKPILGTELAGEVVAVGKNVNNIIVDTAGTAPFSRSKGSLNKGGRLLLVLGGLTDMLWVPWVSIMSNKKVIAGPAAERVEDLHFLAKLAEAGEFKPVIDRRYPFELIADAHRYVDTGRKKGNVVITL